MTSTRTDRPASARHTLVEQPWANQRQMVATLSLIVVVGTIIAALYLLQITVTTTTARELQEMSAQREQLNRDIERLRADIANLQSLPRMMTRAAEMGFRSADEDDILYVIVDDYQYNRPRVTPTPTPTPEPVESIYDETLGGWLRKQWNGLREQFDEWQANQGE